MTACRRLFQSGVIEGIGVGAAGDEESATDVFALSCAVDERIVELATTQPRGKQLDVVEHPLQPARSFFRAILRHLLLLRF